MTTTFKMSPIEIPANQITMQSNEIIICHLSCHNLKHIHW